MAVINPPPQVIPSKIQDDQELLAYFTALNETIYQLWFYIGSNESGLLTNQQTGYATFSNLSTDRTLDADSTTVDEVADVLGTLIEDLKDKDLISS